MMSSFGAAKSLATMRLLSPAHGELLNVDTRNRDLAHRVAALVLNCRWEAVLDKSGKPSAFILDSQREASYKIETIAEDHFELEIRNVRAGVELGQVPAIRFSEEILAQRGLAKKYLGSQIAQVFFNELKRRLQP